MNEEMKKDVAFVTRDRFGDKDYSKYAYFVSKATNCTIIVKPQMEERMANGEIKVSRDENGKEMFRVAIEFHNGMKRLEKTKENEPLIAHLRGIVQKEIELSENKKSIKEVTKPARLYTEQEVKNILAAQEATKPEEKKKVSEEDINREVA